MTHMEELLNFVKDWWGALAGFGAGGVLWGRTTSQVKHLTEAKNAHDDRLKSCERAVQSIEISAAATEAHVQHMAKSLDTLVEEVRRLRSH